MCKINDNIDICVTEVRLFRLSHFMCYHLFINQSKFKLLQSVNNSMHKD